MARRSRSPSTFARTRTRTRFADAADRVSLALQRRFAVDLRALAAFRIALGLLLLIDLVRRSRYLVDFYTDSGVLPRSAWAADYVRFSIHGVSGEAWVQVLLFAVAGAFALALVLGYRTTIATIGSLTLLASLANRNPMVLNGGDELFLALLLWAVFLPLGRRWSIDARRADRSASASSSSSSPPSTSSVTSIATMALLCQPVLVYVTNAIHKTRGDLWLDGEALVYVFEADQFTYLLGDALAGHVTLLRAATYLWLALLVCTPLLLALTGVGRAVVATAFVGAHLGMLVTMRIDLFPLISVASLVPFYQSAVWDGLAVVGARVDRRFRLRRRLRLESLDGVASPGRLERQWERSGFARETSVPSVPALGRRGFSSVLGEAFAPILAHTRTAFSTALPAILLALVVLSNAQSVGYATVPEPVDRVIDATDIDQNWTMFAPDPIRTTYWYVAPGTLEDGTEIDAFDGSQVSWDRPPNVDEATPSARWRKYLSNVRTASNEKHRSYLGNYLCTRWNEDADERGEPKLETVSIYALSAPAEPYEKSETTWDVKLHEHDCAGGLVQSS